MVPATINCGAGSIQQQLMARSPVSPISSCDGAYSNMAISNAFSSASSSPTSPKIVTTMGGQQQHHHHFTNSLQGNISKLSLHCNGNSSNHAFLSGANSNQESAAAGQSLLLAQQPSHHLVSGSAKLSLLQNQRVSSEGGFGLLADVAIAAAEAAEEQSRLEQQAAEAAASAAVQPIDLSKK